MLLQAPTLEKRLLATAADHAARVTTDPRAQELAARSRTVEKDWASAREHVERAIALAPWRLSARLTAARIYAATGDCGAVEEQKAELLHGVLEAGDTASLARARKSLDAIVCAGSAGEPAVAP